jgi:uncharacterized protein YkwD
MYRPRQTHQEFDLQHDAGRNIMVWRFTSLLFVLAFSACSYSPSPTVLASLSDQSRQNGQHAEHVSDTQEKPATEKKTTVASLWDSMKSGLGSKSSTRTMVPANAPITKLDPVVAQKLINEYRSKKGLKPLKLNMKLSAAALKHSSDLAKSDRISHYGSDGSDTWERVKRSGYRARLTAENVGTGQRSIQEVLNGWEHSRDHNANLLLADAEEMGIAMVHKPNTQFKTFWTLVLASEN